MVAGGSRGGARGASVALAVLVLVGAAGCRQDMHDQPRYKAQAGSTFFEDGRAGRPLVPGTVARGHLKEDARLYAAKAGTDYVDTLPFALTRTVLERGQQRFNIFCSPCHDRTGGGGGMIVLRGYKRPPSFHVDRLRQIGVGYFYDVITQGFGTMPSYAAQVPVEDRWAIAAYIRALQLSQNARLADVPAAEKAKLERGEAPGAAGAPAGGGHGGAS